ncbi:MAG TPA: PAS domain S-box protein [Bacteroidia bacterium]|nr:PAS domain S-box protein [Bacteroidia bacterium]
MKNFILLRWLNNVSISRKLYFTVGIMALLIALELATLLFAVNTLSSVRAYVGGEGLWSKAQKDAIYHLEKYGHSRNETDYADFLRFMRVPLGDHKARMEMQKKEPDINVVRLGFIEGRNNPQDVDGMYHLFRRFYRISYIEKAIRIWVQADSASAPLLPLGEQLHKEITSVSPSQEKIDAILQRITPINLGLTRLEDDFSYTLGEGSRWLEQLILKILFCIALTVEISGLLLTFSVSKGIHRGLKEIIRASETVATGNLQVHAQKFSQDEIGQLADSFNRMTDELRQNIHARKQSNVLLRESEERFRLMMKNIKDYAIFMTDVNGYVISWNEAAQRISGYYGEDIIGKHISVFYSDEQVHAGEPMKNLENALKNGDYRVEGWRTRKDGTRFYADVLYTALYDDDGHLKGYAKIIRDITEQKKAEISMRQNEALLIMAQHVAHLGSWEWDLETGSLVWSEEMYRIYGLTQNDRIDPATVVSMTHPADREHVKAVTDETKKLCRPFDFNYRIIRKDNVVRILHARGEVVIQNNGSVKKMIGTAQDITETILEHEMEKLATAATKSYNAVVIADSTGNIEWVNEGFSRLSGYSLEEVKNTHGEILRRGDPTGLSRQMQFYEQILRDKKPVTYEGKNFSRSGKEYWVITTLTPVLGKDGNVERIIAIDSDITERKQIEEDLILANRIAEHSLKKGSRALSELMKAKKELEESLHIKEQFLAKMSHEIRTPMNAIVGLTDLLIEGENLPEQKECLEAVKLSADNLLSIINDILDFSKLESGKVTFEKQPFRVNDVISGVLLTLDYAARKKNISLKGIADMQEIPEYVNGDALRLRQILLNLAGNSIKFTEKGNVTVKAELASRDEENCVLRFTVTDTGIGIAEDKLPAIFESFTQASNETTRKYGGSGLGLTIVRQLTDQQGGSVEVKSKVGKGSVFTVTLPYGISRPEDIAQADAAELQSTEIPEKVKVLLAEDNEMNQMLTRKVFEKWGFALDIAENGKIAVEKLDVEEYDLVLMDIQMPEMDGYEATRFIRSNLPSPKSSIPIIAMTAHAIVGEKEKCIGCGMDDYISKPFDRKMLYEKICRLLHREPVPGEDASPEKDLPSAGMAGEHVTDLTYLRGIAEGNNVFMRKMINAFLGQTPGMLSQMKQYLGSSQWKELRGVAHKMKPSLDFIGLSSIKETVREIEKNAMDETNLETLPDLIGHVTVVCTKAMEELEKELQELE